MTDIADRVADAAERYAHGHDRPVGPYGVLDAVYVGLVGVLGLAARRRGRLPDVAMKDIALVGVATHRLARTIAKDPITSPFRMPFVTYEGTSGPAELHEEVVAEGMGHALGELLTCPFCLSQWVATGFMAGLVFAPRATRIIAATFAGVAVSDFLQYAYAAAQKVEG
jgi:hypothetical protein